MNKIKNVSQIMRNLFRVFFYLAPVITALFWISFESLPKEIIRSNIPVYDYPFVFNLSSQLLGFVVSLLPTGVIMYALHNLIALFSNYGKGAIFTKENVSFYKKLGVALFIWVLVGWIYDALISYVLTFQNAPLTANPIMEIILSGTDLIILLVGAIVTLIAWIMEEAYTIAQEQEGII